MIRRNYIAEVVTPGGTFRQLIQTSGAGGILPENVNEHCDALQEHFANKVHPRATSVTVRPFDSATDKVTEPDNAPKIPDSVKPYFGPNAPGVPAGEATTEQPNG